MKEQKIFFSENELTIKILLKHYLPKNCRKTSWGTY